MKVFRYDNYQKENSNGNWVKFDDVKHIPGIEQWSRFYLNCWGNHIYDENGEWISYSFVEKAVNIE